VVSAFGARKSATPFKHAGRNMLALPDGKSIALFSSYHCSRYNTNTGVLTADMFRDVFAALRAYLDVSSSGDR